MEEPVAPVVANETAPAVETSAVATEASEPKTAPKDKRRTSLFSKVGTITKTQKKSESTSDAEGTDGEKKSQISQKFGLFRKPSKAVKTETPKEPVAVTEPATIPEVEPTLTNGTSEAPKEIIGDVVPEAITTSTPEIRASA